MEKEQGMNHLQEDNSPSIIIGTEGRMGLSRFNRPELHKLMEKYPEGILLRDVIKRELSFIWDY